MFASKDVQGLPILMSCDGDGNEQLFGRLFTYPRLFPTFPNCVKYFTRFFYIGVADKFKTGDDASQLMTHVPLAMLISVIFMFTYI